LTPDESRTLLVLWCMARSPLMVGGDLPTSSADTVALLANPALREVTAGSSENGETVRERIFKRWGDDATYRGDLIVWAAKAVDWADGTPTSHPHGYYAALFWTGDTPYRLGDHIELKSIVGLGCGRIGAGCESCDDCSGESGGGSSVGSCGEACGGSCDDGVEADSSRCANVDVPVGHGGWKITDLFAGTAGYTGDVKITGTGDDRVISGVIPPHGVLWVALDPVDC
jgi:hypothetical protein